MDASTLVKWLGAAGVGVGLLALGRAAFGRPQAAPGAPAPAGPPLPTLPPFRKGGPSMSFLDGIDVSKWQGYPGGTGMAAPPDWPRVKDQASIDFVICKAVHGAAPDPSFAYNWPRTSIFMARGAYCYGRFADSPTKQAEALVAACQNFGGLRPSGDLLAVDLEWGENEAFVLGTPKSPKKPQTEHCAWWIRSFVAQVIERTGRPCLIYTGPGFWSAMGSPDIPELGSFPLWTAQYTLAAKPDLFGPWKGKRWTMWQYQGDTGPARYDRHVPGINAAVDRNFFDGSPEDLKALTEVRV